MCVHTPVDGDGDGFAAASVTPSAGGPTFMCAGGTDCDDSRDRVFPGAPELCNGRDDDCDTMVDEGCDTRPDTCATAREIVVGATGTTTVGGSFGGLHDDYQTSPICGAMSRGRDAVYYFDLPRGLFDVTIDTIGSDADTVLGVGFSCDAAGLQLACNDDIVDGDTNSRIWLHRVGSATSTTRVFVLVDAFRDSVTGDYLLNVSRRPAASDSCPAPIAGEPMDISGGGTVLGYNSRFFGAQRGNCAPATTPNPPEAVFSLTSSGGGMRFDVYSVDFSPIIYSRRTCDAFGSELGCSLPASAGGVSRATLEVPLAPGNLTYFFVDGGRGSYAAYYRPL
ncbi:MAG TPA: hypothetical protein ENK57_00530 [Polyangiaceae bacterium]|nr:hypothetical protein [Polyangiaceae bacterium]